MSILNPIFVPSVNSVRSSFANQGEICLCGSRVFIQRGIYDRFVEMFVEAAKQIKVDNPTSKTATMGALISKEHLAKVNYYIELAQQEGGKILLGGDRPEVEDELKDGKLLTFLLLSLFRCFRV